MLTDPLRGCTWLIVALAACACVAGLGSARVYGELALAPAMRGQDLLTLLVLPALLAADLQRAPGPASQALRLGLLGYLLYTYTGAAFGYPWSSLFLLYIALFALCASALWLAVRRLDVCALSVQLGTHAPRRAAAGFLLFVAFVLVASELPQIVFAHWHGQVPALIERSQGAGKFVYVLDLGVIAPLSVLAAHALWRGAPVGDALAAGLLVKSATMGLALVSMSWFAARAGSPQEPGLSLVYALIAVLGLGMACWFLWPHGRLQEAHGRAH